MPTQSSAAPAIRPDQGLLACLRSKRVPEYHGVSVRSSIQRTAQGSFSSSAVGAGDHLYCFNEDGLGQVIALEEDAGEIIHTHSLGETVLCTPAISDGAIYVRSDGHLWKFAAK